MAVIETYTCDQCRKPIEGAEHGPIGIGIHTKYLGGISTRADICSVPCLEEWFASVIRKANAGKWS